MFFSSNRINVYRCLQAANIVFWVLHKEGNIPGVYNRWVCQYDECAAASGNAIYRHVEEGARIFAMWLERAIVIDVETGYAVHVVKDVHDLFPDNLIAVVNRVYCHLSCCVYVFGRIAHVSITDTVCPYSAHCVLSMCMWLNKGSQVYTPCSNHLSVIT